MIIYIRRETYVNFDPGYMKIIFLSYLGGNFVRKRGY